jgi:hypothetical protein
MCVYTSGQASLNAGSIGGVEVPERVYVIRDHVVVLAGHPDGVLHHDAETLLASGVYRLPTPDEQEQRHRQQSVRGMIQEGCDA